MDERLLVPSGETKESLKLRVWEESKKIWRITFPAMLSRVTFFGMYVVTQAFIGHISEVDLAAYALIQTIIVRLVQGITEIFVVQALLYPVFFSFIIPLRSPLDCSEIWLENSRLTDLHYVRWRSFLEIWRFFFRAINSSLHFGDTNKNNTKTGMSSATETLCGQAFGAKQYHMLGIYLQRSWIINVLTQTIFLPLFIFATPLFRLLGQEEEIARSAGSISLWFIPITYSSVFYNTIQRYLQAQLKNMVVGLLCTASFLFHILLSWIFVIKLNWGIPGAMSSLIIANFLIVFGEFIYIFGGWCPDTWKGFTLACFPDLIPVVKLSISSGVMLCLELWYNAVLVLLAGYVKNATVAISAFSICINIIYWELMLSLGFLAASSVRVSNELGRGDAKAAKFSIKVIVGTSICIGVLFWALCLIFGHEIGYLFTSDDQVAESVSQLSVLLSFSILLNSVTPVLSGVAIGAGRQTIVAYINIGSYYVIGIPFGAILGYIVGLEIKGIWIGMLTGVAIQSTILCSITARTDWEEQVKKASERLNKWLLKPSSDVEENPDK